LIRLLVAADGVIAIAQVGKMPKSGASRTFMIIGVIGIAG
jgi:hypothetical protein